MVNCNFEGNIIVVGISYQKVALIIFLTIIEIIIYRQYNETLYQNKIIMIDNIKQEISKIYNLDDPKGIFMSAFDEKNNLILSNGVLTSDKSLGKVVEMIYHGLIEKHTNTTKIICDIVTKIETKTTLEQINMINLSLQGLCIQTTDNSKSGVLLP
jgi:hypothetical protein